jgi:hypothetical protein
MTTAGIKANSCIFTADENVFLSDLRGLSVRSFWSKNSASPCEGPLFSAISAHILRVLCGLRF